ncbi:MAG TPA: ABC transporter permease [Thermoanaerobaculia bacterium]|jgi:putative ABC transport system permease protein
METLLRDLRFALRMLRRSPGFTCSAVLCLALSLGANTSVFSLLNAVLLRGLPYQEPERIMMIWNQFLGDDQREIQLSNSELLDLREQTRSFTEIAATRPGLFSLTGDGDPDLLVGVRVSANLFHLLGVKAAAGRTFLPGEDQPGHDDVVILSHGLFERRYGSDPSVVGRKVTINGKPFTVVGVTPRDFYFRRKGRDLWMPLIIDRAALGARDDRPLEAYARLRSGVTPEAARTELGDTARRWAAEHPETYPTKSGYGLAVVSYREQIVGQIRPVLLVLAAAVGLVLLIACANISNLLLARATTRDREIALRTALGAGRGGLVRQFLTESLLLAACGGALGLLLTAWCLKAIGQMDLSKIPRIDEVSIDGRVLAFTILVSLLTGILFGLVPALQISRRDFHAALKEGAKSSAGAGRNLFRRVLVVLEVAVALVVLLGAGLMIQSFRRLQEVDLGFKTANILSLELFLPTTKYSTPSQQTAFFGELLERLRALPGVSSAGGVSAMPLGVVQSIGEVVIEGAPPPAPGQLNPSVAWRSNSPSYFQTLGIPLVKGRDFVDGDDERAEPVVIVDQSSARHFWPHQEPIGKRLKLVGQGAADPWRSVVGVVGNVKHEGPEVDSREQIYVPFRQHAQPFLYLLLHTPRNAGAVAGPARKAVLGIDKNQAVFRVETMDEKLVRTMAWRRFYTLLLAAFALVALVLAVVGVYSVMAYSVTQRTREIGIRMALGAERGAVTGLVVRQALGLTGLGVVLGLAVALGLLRIVSSLLYGVSATDVKTFVCGALLLTAFALLASYLPARRASRVDPTVALRTE